MSLKLGERDRAILEALLAARDIVAMVRAGHLRNLYAAQAGPKAAAYDGTPRTRGGDGGPLAGPDQPAFDLAHLDRHLAAFVKEGDIVRRVLRIYAPARPAGEADRLALARENRPPGPTCQHCATIKEPFGDGPYRVEADHRRKGATTVAGRLPEPLVLCAWCADFTAAHDRLPSARQLEQHRDGRRVMVVDDTPRRAS